MSVSGESPRSGPGGGKEYFLDSKLIFRLKQFVGEQRERGAPVTEDGAFNFMLDKFKEYARKPQAPLRKSIGRALRKCLEDNPTPQLHSKKRAWNSEEGDEEHQRHQTPRKENGKVGKKTRGKAKSEINKGDSEEVSEDELVARGMEASMQGHSHNLLNQSVAAGYRNGAKSSMGTERDLGESDKMGRSAQKRTKRPRPGGGLPVTPTRASVSGAGSGNSGSNASGAAGTGGFIVERPSTRYSDLGGISGILQEVRELIEYPLVHPEVYAHLGIEPPRGILLHGPPGCGKTLLANAIAGELNVAFLKISAPEIVSGMSGESEQKVRELFRAAIENAPCIVFMDEVDAITPKRETSSRGMEKRIVAQLLTCMDSLTMENTRGKPVIVIGATNRPNDLDSALRRAGRFDREICLGVPDRDARARILQVMSSKMTLSGDVDFHQIAKKTPGYVGADLSSLTKEAAVVAINRIFTCLRASPVSPTETPTKTSAEAVASTGSALSGGGVQGKALLSAGAEDKQSMLYGEGPEGKQVSIVSTDSGKGGVNDVDTKCIAGSPDGASSSTQKGSSARATGGAKDAVGGFLSGPLSPEQLAPLSVTMEDFLMAVKKVQPSAKREGFATVPGVTWDDVGALASVREELSLSILEPITYPERFEKLGLTIPAGVLLYGPPGCGKTLLAKAIANESGANFISVKGPELLDKYVGESEKSVRQVFLRARASSPCIIFFDELDALCPRRGGAGGEGSGVSERVVNQLLTEMDGLEARRNVFVVAATNRPELIDPAMLRPGRLDRLLYVPLPSSADRVSILKALSASVALGPDVDLEAIGRTHKAEGFSGADLAALLREAGLDVLRQLKNRESSSGTDVYAEEGAGTVIIAANFENAFLRTQPSVSVADRKFYVSMKDRLCKARAHSSAAPDQTGTADDKNSVRRLSGGDGPDSDASA